jgi:tetratricopeptide (TPR) repeat protein
MIEPALNGLENLLGLEHPLTLETVHKLSNLYADQNKLTEAEVMYERALQGYENILGLEIASTHPQVLEVMFDFADLLSQTNRKDMAKTMYNRALSGYATKEGPFSPERCLEIKDRLQALEDTSVG